MVIVCVVLPSGLRAQDASAVGRAAQADAVYRQGITSLQQGDLAAARTAFEKAVQLSPRSPEGHNSLGWVLLAQQRAQPAPDEPVHTAEGPRMGMLEVLVT